MNTLQLCRASALVLLVAVMSACGRTDPAAFITSARSYMEKSDYKAAIIELKNALKEAPNNGEARFLLAKSLLENGDPGAAETEARKALDLKYPAEEAYPVLARALLKQGQFKKLDAEMANRRLESGEARAEIGTALGLAHLAQGEKKEARLAIEAAIAAKPDSVNARIALARLTAVDDDLPGALKLVDAAVAAAPGNIDALLLKADIESALGRTADAIMTLERVVAIRPESARARFGLISLLTRSKETDKAAAQLELVKKNMPNDPRTLHAEALLAFVRGDLVAAREATQKSRQVAPEFLPSVYLSGIVEYQLGSYAAAEDALQVVVANAPGDDGARRALAATYLRRGHAAQALETLEPSLKRTPDNPVLLRTVAEVYLAMNDPRKSAEYFERAIALDKGNTSGRVRLAQVHLATGDAGQAFKDLEDLSAADPNRQEADLALISAHLRRREFDKALAAARALEKKQPSNPMSHTVKGVVYTAMRDVQNARASFDKALALDPTYFAAAYNLARLDVSQRNFDGARKRYEQMLAKDPKSETVLLALAELQALTKAPPEEIRKAIERAITANPLSVRARLALISYNAQLRDWPAALAAAQAARSAMPENPQILEAVGATQQAAGETNQALETLRRAAQLQPENPSPLIRLAEIQLKSKEYDGAINSLRSALAVQPDNAGVWVTLANAYATSGNIDAGIAEARKTQKDRPDRAVGFALEGELLAHQKKWPEAATAYRSALALQPLAFVVIRLHFMLVSGGKQEEATVVARKWLLDHPKDAAVRKYLGQQSLAHKDYKNAAQYLSAAVQIEPDNVLVLNNLAWVLGELGDPKAVAYGERAYALAPNAAPTVDTLGWLLVQRGDTARGAELLRKAAELGPNDPEIRLHLAKALLKIGDKVAARKELETLAKPETASSVRDQAEKLLKGL